MTLQASGLAFARGDRLLFDALDFRLGAGEALHVTGANGSGKTSLLRLLAGLARPLRGTLSWWRVPLAELREEWRRGLVYCGHAAALKGELSAVENLQLAQRLAGFACTPDAAIAALAAIGLGAAARLPVQSLSQGQRKRVSLARLFVADSSSSPRCLLLDEPFDALDATAIATLAARLEALVAAGACLVYTSHQARPVATARELRLDARFEAPV